MAISLQNRFQVQAPIEAVWQFLMDPQSVVMCMPGAQLEEIVDSSTFLGSVKVAVGPITMSYKGRVQFTSVDEAEHLIRLAAEGRETGGGSALGSMSSSLRATPEGHTEVEVDVSMDVTGRIVQMGRGLMQDVAADLFGQFVGCVKQSLENESPTEDPDGVAVAAEPVRVVPLFLRALGSILLRFLRRILGRPADG